MAFDCMDDCIHLKACRRIQAIGRKHRLMVPRYCTEECTAYRNADEVISNIREKLQFAFDEGTYGAEWISWNDPDGFVEWLKGDEK